MQMFETFLSSIPKNRSEMVNDLDIPDVYLSPYIWDPIDDYLPPRKDSWRTTYSDDYVYRPLRSLSTDSSIPLSRAMTDSDIDYERYRRYKNRCYSDTWEQMKHTLDSFPKGYLDSLNKYCLASDYLDYVYTLTPSERRRYDEELRRRMRKFFAEECTVFPPGDAGLEALEDAIKTVDMKIRNLRTERLCGKYPYSSYYPYYSPYYPYYSTYSKYYPYYDYKTRPWYWRKYYSSWI